MNTPQTGGVDPGLAALIAAILSGSVGAYGYSQDARTADEKITAQVEKKYADQLREAQRDRGARKTLEDTKAEVAVLKARLAELEQKNTALQSSASAVTKSNETFKNASSDVLKAAIPGVIAALSSKYAWVQPETPNLKKALLYPTEYAGRLARMNLYDFYQKRVAPAMEKDMKPPAGGRRRYRRRARGGGSEEFIDKAVAEQKAQEEAASLEDVFNSAGKVVPVATAPAAVEPVAVEATRLTSVPPYEDFAMEYTKAIEEATKTMPTARQAYNDKLKAKREGIEEGKRIIADKKAEKAAQDAAEAMARKISKAIDEAKKEIAKQEKTVVNLPGPDLGVSLAKAELDAALEEGTLISTVPPEGAPQKHSDLSLYVTTSLVGLPSVPGTIDTSPKWVNTWNAKKPAAEKVLEDIPALVKKYSDAVKEASKAPKPVPNPAEPEVEDAFSVENPLLAPKEAPEPALPVPEAVPVTQENVDIVNPLLVGDTGKTPAQLLSNPLRSGQVLKGDVETAPAERVLKRGMSFFAPKKNPLTQRKLRKGGKARKRTLKKRRGGK